MLEKIKLALRLKTNTFDAELNMYINACKNNLRLAGIKKIVENDDCVLTTIISYCKWQMNYQGEGDKWQKVYEDLKLGLALDSNYVYRDKIS